MTQKDADFYWTEVGPSLKSVANQQVFYLTRMTNKPKWMMTSVYSISMDARKEKI
jgi:hypothetical protein